MKRNNGLVCWIMSTYFLNFCCHVRTHPFSTRIKITTLLFKPVTYKMVVLLIVLPCWYGVLGTTRIKVGNDCFRDDVAFSIVHVGCDMNNALPMETAIRTIIPL